MSPLGKQDDTPQVSLITIYHGAEIPLFLSFLSFHRPGGDIHRMVRRFIQDAPDTKPNHIATPNQTILPHQTLEGPQGSLCNTTHITGTNCKYHQWYSGCLLCLNDTPQPFSS